MDYLVEYDPATGNPYNYYPDDGSAPHEPNLVLVDETLLNAWLYSTLPLPYRVIDGALTAPTQAQIDAFYAAQAWAAYQMTALAALVKSDITVIRCYEHAVPVTPEWGTYRDLLRVIMSTVLGDPTLPLPVAPDYPPGS